MKYKACLKLLKPTAIYSPRGRGLGYWKANLYQINISEPSRSKGPTAPHQSVCREVLAVKTYQDTKEEEPELGRCTDRVIPSKPDLPNFEFLGWVAFAASPNFSLKESVAQDLTTLSRAVSI